VAPQRPLIGIIDDDQSLRTALVRLIRSLGYGARDFTSAEEFMESGALGECSCVIADVQMPGISGIDLVKLIAERQSTVPVIVITARMEPRLKYTALASGAISFLRKPLDSEKLAECLETALKA
jgi:FixJ family two-component response regulator